MCTYIYMKYVVSHANFPRSLCGEFLVLAVSVFPCEHRYFFKVLPESRSFECRGLHTAVKSRGRTPVWTPFMLLLFKINFHFKLTACTRSNLRDTLLFRPSHAYALQWRSKVLLTPEEKPKFIRTLWYDAHSLMANLFRGIRGQW